MKKLDIHEVVRLLTGPIHPVGSEHIDSSRYKNITELGNLVLTLVDDLREVAMCRGSGQSSVDRMGESAQVWLDEIKENIS